MRKRVLLALGYFNSDLYHGIVSYARQAKWILDITMVQYGRLPDGWNGDGVLTLLVQARDDLIDFARDFDGPVVDFSWDVPELEVSRVIPDNSAAGRLGAEHLLERGYRNVAFVQISDSYNIRGCESGFRVTCMQAGANYMHWDYPSSPEAKEGQWLKWLCRMLASAPRPLGVMAQSDNQALKVLAACDELGLSVPQDLALVGVSNNEVACELASVPLSSVDFGWQELGYSGAELLSGILEGTATPPGSPVQIAPRSVITRLSSDICAVDHPEVSTALAYIWANFRNSINVDDVMEHISISRCSLYSLFKKHLGRTISAEITRKRMEAAEQLLRESDQKVRVVAERSGFSSTIHMIRVFHKIHNCTPGEYRQRCR
ncbi:MAG: substrate-binding domain-containing protein [bacterium]|nr:substrate-binding domain-containing protein [bacterium]